MNANRRSVAPMRKLVAAILGTIAVFVMVFGLGMTSWPIVALGAAMLALAIGLTLVNVVRRGARTWVVGTAHVTAASEPPASSSFGRCELQIVVAAPGLPTSAVKVRDPRVPIAKWPVSGDTLPVMVDVDDMRRIRIKWDDVPTHTEAAMNPAPAYADPLDDLPAEDDELLREPEDPPWVTRDRQWGRGPDEPPTPPGGGLDDPYGDRRSEDLLHPANAGAGELRGGDLRGADLRADLRSGELREGSPVVVREAPGGGPIVLEGTLVESDTRPGPLPRRPRPSPYPGQRQRPRPSAAASAPDIETIPGTDDPVAAGPVTHESVAPASPITEPIADPAVDSTSDPVVERAAEPLAEPASAPATPVVPQARTAPAETDDEPLIDLDEPDRSDSRAATTGRGAWSSAVDTSPERPAAKDSTATGSTATGSTAIAEPQPVDPDIDLPLDEHPPTPAEPKLAGPEPVAAAHVTPEPINPEPVNPEPVAAARVDPEPVAPEPEPAEPEPIDLDLEARAGEPEAYGRHAARDEASELPGSSASEPSEPAVTDDGTATDDARPAPAAAVGVASVAAATAVGVASVATAAARAQERSDVAVDDRIDELITAYPSARPGPAGAIHGVGITVLVTDLARSIGFYRDMLGFFEIDGGHGSAVLASGDTRLVLRTVHDLSPMTGRLIYLNLEVGDVEAVYGELRAKGVKFVHGPRAVNRGGRLELWAASFHDPDGHNIAITQWRALT